MALIGLKNLYYAKMTIGANDAESYESPKKIGEAIEVDINPVSQTSKLYGDDMAVAAEVNVQEVSVTIEVTDIPLEDQAVLLGHTYSAQDGLTANMADRPPYVALLFESDKEKGGTRCTKLLKGKFVPTQSTTRTRGEQLQYQTPKLTGTFVAAANGDWKKEKDFAEGADTSSWYESV